LDKPQNLVFTLSKELFKIAGTLQKVEGFLFWDVSPFIETFKFKVKL